MARRRQTPFPSYKTCEPDFIEKQFVQVGQSQLWSEPMLSLNHASFRLYIYMLEASKGKQTFEFPRSKYQKFLSKGGFQKCVYELQTAGFIEVVQHNKNLRKPNVYKFSDNWKTGC